MTTLLLKRADLETAIGKKDKLLETLDSLVRIGAIAGYRLNKQSVAINLEMRAAVAFDIADLQTLPARGTWTEHHD